jgi:2-methylisocitrate lyase-like PEP mutase family enzyme
MSQIEKAKAFHALHRKGDPLVLYNIWDAGTAAAVAAAGAPALATGSWSVAAANGYSDGEAIPLDVLVSVARSVIASTDLPVSIDFEGAYSDDPNQAAANVALLMDAGAIGINFEDQIVGGQGLHSIENQMDRIRAIRAAANARALPFFINARTDLFLKASDDGQHEMLLEEAIARAHAFAEAGANGFFAPWLADPALISKLCAASPLPVNIMMKPGAPTVTELAACGVARVSYGPGPYRAMIAWLKGEAAGVYGA